MRKRLKRKFFTRNTLTVAKEMLGKCIIRRYRNKEIIGKIVEVEAYIGPEDKASHAYGGKVTPRNRAEYLIGGHVYIYLVYGMYYQFNISTGKEGFPECVLIRAVEPVANLKDRKGSGPGKFCQSFKLNKSFYGEDLTKSQRLWLEDWGEKISKSQIASSGRIGIDYAGAFWSKVPWRFYLRNNRFVSVGLKLAWVRGR